MVLANISIHCITRGRCGILKLRSRESGQRINVVSHRLEQQKTSGRMFALALALYCGGQAFYPSTLTSVPDNLKHNTPSPLAFKISNAISTLHSSLSTSTHIVFWLLYKHELICLLLLFWRLQTWFLCISTYLTWASGRASNWWGAGVVICLERGANDLHTWSSWCHCHPIIMSH